MKPIKAQNRPKGTILGALWAGFPCEARCVEAVIAPSTWTWCMGLVGDLRKAIEVTLNDQTIYVDNADGRALQAFLQGIAPLAGFRFVPTYTAFDDPDSKQVYHARLA